MSHSRHTATEPSVGRTRPQRDCCGRKAPAERPVLECCFRVKAAASRAIENRSRKRPGGSRPQQGAADAGGKSLLKQRERTDGACVATSFAARPSTERED